MKQIKATFLTIDDYIKIQEKDKQAGLEKLRTIIKKVAPKATECISYQMLFIFLSTNHFRLN